MLFSISAIQGVLKLMFGGWKNWLATVLIGVLVVSLWNKMIYYTSVMIAWGIAKIIELTDIDLTENVLAITGFAAYMAQHLRIADCMAFMVQIYILKWLLRKIPVIKW